MLENIYEPQQASVQFVSVHG